jgi:hypothetical protein
MIQPFNLTGASDSTAMATRRRIAHFQWLQSAWHHLPNHGKAATASRTSHEMQAPFNTGHKQ